MKIRSFIIICFFTLGALVHAKDAGGKDAFKLINAETLSSWEKATPKNVFLFDANNDGTRAKFGTIPGSTLLSSYNKYDTQSTLPQDKSAKLVFFCANTMCMASHAAAKRAVEAGYQNVSVMSDGVMGWKDKGFELKKL